MNDDIMTPIGAEQRFRFTCSVDTPCLNQCCRDMHQFLTPYDILRLKRALGMPSQDFLTGHTHVRTGPRTGLPVVTLRKTGPREKACRFSGPSGCAVYEGRPSACRTYPLARAVSRARDTGELTEHFMLIREPHCLGFTRGEERTVRQWMENQELIPFNRFNDMMMTVISLKNRIMPGPLPADQEALFRLALYDLDRFRESLLGRALPDTPEIPDGILAMAEGSDESLLCLGMEWIGHALFNVPMDFQRLENRISTETSAP